MMKKILIFGIVLSLVMVGGNSFGQQNQKAKPEVKKKAPESSLDEIPKIDMELLRQNKYVYSPGDRRDPFKNLLAGQEMEEKTGEVGSSDVFIDNVVLIGIFKSKGIYTGIIRGPQGFPLELTVGNSLADGYVLSIDESKVVFRKTKERGVPMFRPVDVTKEINPQER